MLQEKRTSLPILAIFGKEGRYTIDTDACDHQLGSVLLEKLEDNVAKPLGYCSKILKTEKGV